MSKKENKVPNRTVYDFHRGMKIFFSTFIYIVLFLFILVIMIGDKPIDKEYEDMMIIILIFVIFTPFRAFWINYKVLIIKNSKVTIPAHDQIRTFTDIIILNPVTGYFRRRTYNVNEIENVANGYTRAKTNKQSRDWNVVITGTHNSNSFSQRIDCSNKQVRDEIRNALRETIKGSVSSEFSY